MMKIKNRKKTMNANRVRDGIGYEMKWNCNEIYKSYSITATHKHLNTHIHRDKPDT